MTTFPNAIGHALAAEPGPASLDACEPLAPPGKIPPGKIHVVPAAEARPEPAGWAERAYRGLEIIIALIGLVVGAPIILLAGLLLRLESPGPIIFRHRRAARSTQVYGRTLVGRTDLHPPPGGYRPDALYYVPSYFTLPKLRTMHNDARERFPELYAYDFSQESFGQFYSTVKDDPRVTRVGAILRKLSVDELPNFWPVLTGQLRLVGPRPEAPETLQYYRPEEMHKFTRAPGITGLAQVSGRGLLNCRETIQYDLEYVRTRTIALDIEIIAMTIKRVIARHGAF